MTDQSFRHHRWQRAVWRLSLLTLLIVVLLPWRVGNAQDRPLPETLSVADAHFHLLDFLQNGACLDPKSGQEMSPTVARTLPHFQSHLRLKLLLQKMDEAIGPHATADPCEGNLPWKSSSLPTILALTTVLLRNRKQAGPWSMVRLAIPPPIVTGHAE